MARRSLWFAVEKRVLWIEALKWRAYIQFFFNRLGVSSMEIRSHGSPLYNPRWYEVVIEMPVNRYARDFERVIMGTDTRLGFAAPLGATVCGQTPPRMSGGKVLVESCPQIGLARLQEFGVMWLDYRRGLRTLKDSDKEWHHQGPRTDMPWDEIAHAFLSLFFTFGEKTWMEPQGDIGKFIYEHYVGWFGVNGPFNPSAPTMKRAIRWLRKCGAIDATFHGPKGVAYTLRGQFVPPKRAARSVEIAPAPPIESVNLTMEALQELEEELPLIFSFRPEVSVSIAVDARNLPS